MNNEVYEWHNAFEAIERYVFKIATPRGHGTGFLMFHPSGKDFCGVATAFHVVEHEFNWEETIKLTHYKSGETITLINEDRVIFPYPERDLAVILFKKHELSLPDGAVELIPPKSSMKVGVEVGWCGFPAVSPGNLCFFAGHVSCFLDGIETYLVDGVAINGVSGGPALMKIPTLKKTFVTGVVSAYQPNTATGAYLPGVSIVSSVEPIQKDLEIWKSLSEAKEREEEIKSASPSPSPSLPPPESENAK